MMDCSGVRNSWLMLATNSDLAREASSARSRASRVACAAWRASVTSTALPAKPSSCRPWCKGITARSNQRGSRPAACSATWARRAWPSLSAPGCAGTLSCGENRASVAARSAGAARSHRRRPSASSTPMPVMSTQRSLTKVRAPVASVLKISSCRLARVTRNSRSLRATLACAASSRPRECSRARRLRRASAVRAPISTRAAAAGRTSRRLSRRHCAMTCARSTSTSANRGRVAEVLKAAICAPGRRPAPSQAPCSRWGRKSLNGGRTDRSSPMAPGTAPVAATSCPP